MALPPTAAVPKNSQSTPPGTATAEPAIGSAPSESPGRISSLEQAQDLLTGEGLAEATELAISLNQFDDTCERPGELFDLLAAARHLGRVRSLTLNLPGCIPSEMLARLASAKLPALRRLVVPSLGPRGAATLAECPLLAQLDELDLSNSKPGRAGVAALGRSPHLRALKILRLHYSLDSTDVGLALADTPAWTGLHELDLSTGILTGEALVGLARNPALAGLEVLDIGRSRGSGPARIAAFARAGGLPGLRVLRVDRVSLGDAELTVIVGARQWLGLRELDLSSNKIGPAGAKALARATRMSALERLDLDGNRLGPQGGRALSGAAHLAGLRHLDLSGCEIGEAAAVHLVALLRAPEVLLLSGNALGDAGARALASRGEWTGLHTLDLSTDAIGPDGAAVLAGAAHLASLETFKIRGNPLDERGWRAMVESQPLARFVDATWRRELALRDTTLSPVDAARPLPADLEIDFRRGACHGSCPVYRVTIRGDVLEYRGEQHVKIAGPIRERVDPTRIRLILASVDAFVAGEPGRRAPSWPDCRNSLYGDEGPSIRVLGGGRTFVYGRDGVCPSQADQETFRLLTDRVDALLDTDRWTGRRMW